MSKQFSVGAQYLLVEFFKQNMIENVVSPLSGRSKEANELESKVLCSKAKFHWFKIYLVLWSLTGCLSHWGKAKDSEEVWKGPVPLPLPLPCMERAWPPVHKGSLHSPL